MITEKEMVSAIVNCTRKNEKKLVDEKAFLITLSLGIPIDDFYDVDNHITYRGLNYSLITNCEDYLEKINKYDDETILKASLYMFNLIRRGIKEKLEEKTSRLLSELNLLYQ